MIGDARLHARRQPRNGRMTASCSTPSAPTGCPCTCSRTRPSSSTSRGSARTACYAFHISNNYLDLKPVVGGVAHSLGLIALRARLRSISEAGARRAQTRSTWVVVARMRTHSRR